MILEVLEHTVIITGFIFVMMVIIDFINIQTRGMWQKSLIKSKWSQYLISGFLGAIPGCLGSFTAVGLFSHGIISFGAIVTCMIATSGDAAFLMFAVIPREAVIITVVLFIIGVLVGKLTGRVFKFKTGKKQLEIHEDDSCICFDRKKIPGQLKNLTLQRGALIILIVVLLLGVIFEKIGHDAESWIRITFVIVASISLFIVITVSEHFLEEHLWNHVVKKHIPPMFLWIFGTLVFLHFLTEHLDLKVIVENNQFVILLLAVLIGLIPDSGPHIIFITLFAQGAIPFSILLANSVVQDGHGMLPMLAESRKKFVKIKLLNFIVGLVVGVAGLLIQGFLA